MPDPAAKLAVVVGAPLAGLPQIDEPSAADVAKWHAAYVAALRALFDRHKAKHAFDGAAAELEIIE
jgi:2-acylglycerol O-acyltransferase 2